MDFKAFVMSDTEFAEYMSSVANPEPWLSMHMEISLKKQ